MEFIASRDRNDRLWFAELGSHHANRILEENGAPIEGIDSVVVVKNGILLTHSCALAAICESLEGPFRLVGTLIRVVPKPIRDGIYAAIARNRMFLSRNNDLCDMRSSHLSNKFLAKRDR